MFNLIIYTYIIYKYMYIYTCTVYIHIHILYVHTHTFEVIFSEGFYPLCMQPLSVKSSAACRWMVRVTPPTPPRSHLHYTWAAFRWRPRPHAHTFTTPGQHAGGGHAPHTHTFTTLVKKTNKQTKT